MTKDKACNKLFCLRQTCQFIYKHARLKSYALRQIRERILIMKESPIKLLSEVQCSVSLQNLLFCVLYIIIYYLYIYILLLLNKSFFFFSSQYSFLPDLYKYVCEYWICVPMIHLGLNPHSIHHLIWYIQCTFTKIYWPCKFITFDVSLEYIAAKVGEYLLDVKVKQVGWHLVLRN